MLACCAVLLTIIGKLMLLDSTWLPGHCQEGRGSWEACDWWSRWESLWRIWGGGGRGLLIPVRPCRLEEGTSSAVVREPCLLQAPRRTMEAGRWPLTAPPLSPSHSSAALGWQEKSELYCHPGKNLSSYQEPPFRCMDEAVSLFSRGGLMALSSRRWSNRAEHRSYDSPGQ